MKISEFSPIERQKTMQKSVKGGGALVEVIRGDNKVSVFEKGFKGGKG